MHRILIHLVLALCLFPTHAARGDPADQSAAVMGLLDLFTSGEDSDAIRAAVRQIASDRSPTEALADYAKLVAAGSGRGDLSAEVRNAMQRLGNYIALHPAEFPGGLPDLGGFKRRRLLGPLFEGMRPQGWQSDAFEKRLEILDPLINDSWLDAAVRCGEFDFHHLMRAHRGELGKMLLAYQDSGDEVGIIRLGEVFGRHARPVRDIDPRGFSTRTLALFLSGASGVHDPAPSESYILVETFFEWRTVHPDLMNALKDLREDRNSLCFFEAGDLWRRREWDAALEVLFSKPRTNAWPVSSFLNSLLIEGNPADEKVTSLARLIPTDALVSCIRQLLDDDKADDIRVRLACLMMPEFHSRSDRTKEHWIPYSMDVARKTALRWWLDRRIDDAHRLLQEAFFNLKPPDYTDDMLRFAATARAFGKESSVMDELEKRAKKPGYSDLTLHKAALLTVAGKHREALELARSRPPGELYYQLLAECEEWDELRKLESEDAQRFKRVCHAAFLNQDAKTARDYFKGLTTEEKEQSALLLVLSGNDELCQQHAGKLITDKLSYSSLPFPISLNAFDVWERAIVEDLDAVQAPLSETVLKYISHTGMTRDQAKTIQTLVRLTKTGPLRSNINGSGSRSFSDSLIWQHRIAAARCLIDMGAVDEGCRALEAIERDGADRVDRLRDDFWRAFLPSRFATNGIAEYLKIAELELPAATKLERHLFLTRTLVGISVPEAVSRMLGLLEKHRAEIPINDASLLLQKVSIALWGVPEVEKLRSEAVRVFALYQPTEEQSGFFQRWAKPAPWKDRFSSHTEIEEKPGNQHDPKSTDFRVFDGMAEIRSLLANQRLEAAEALFRDMQIRILLDDLPREKINLNTETNQGSYGVTGDQYAEFLPVIAAHCWNLQAPFLREYALTVWRCRWHFHPRDLAPYLAGNGDFREARIAAIVYQDGWGANDLNIIQMLPAIEGLGDASEGRVDSALDRLDVCMNLSPFDPTSGMAILNAFRKRGDEPAFQKAVLRIREYWQQLIGEYPDSPQVREAAHYWLGELERSLR